MAVVAAITAVSLAGSSIVALSASAPGGEQWPSFANAKVALPYVDDAGSSVMVSSSADTEPVVHDPVVPQALPSDWSLLADVSDSERANDGKPAGNPAFEPTEALTRPQGAAAKSTAPQSLPGTASDANAAADAEKSHATAPEAASTPPVAAAPAAPAPIATSNEAPQAPQPVAGAPTAPLMPVAAPANAATTAPTEAAAAAPQNAAPQAAAADVAAPASAVDVQQPGAVPAAPPAVAAPAAPVAPAVEATASSAPTPAAAPAAPSDNADKDAKASVAADAKSDGKADNKAAAKTLDTADKAASPAAAQSANATAFPGTKGKGPLMRRPIESDYYQKRAREMLKADGQEQNDDGLDQAYPDHTIVSCIAGCGPEKAKVVYMNLRKDLVVESSGEVVPTAAGADDAAPAATGNSVMCVAGCYDQPRQVFKSPTRVEIESSLKRSAATQVSRRPLRGAALAPSKVSASAQSAQTDAPAASQQPKRERSGAWFTRINSGRKALQAE